MDDDLLGTVVCSKCGHIYPEGSAACPACGAVRSAVAETAEVGSLPLAPPPPPAPTSAAGPTKHVSFKVNVSRNVTCPACKAKYPLEAAACPACGATNPVAGKDLVSFTHSATTQVIEKFVCNGCGTAFDAKLAGCPNCGMKNPFHSAVGEAVLSGAGLVGRWMARREVRRLKRNGPNGT